MGDKSPKAKQRDKKQRDAAKQTVSDNQAKRQAAFASQAAKPPKK